MEDIDSGAVLKEKLLTAGIDEILAHGIKNFSLRRVAAACGASCAAPYKHFKNKEEFVNQIIAYVEEKWLLLSEQINAAFSDPKERIAQLCLANVRFKVSNPIYGMGGASFAPNIIKDIETFLKNSDYRKSEFDDKSDNADAFSEAEKAGGFSKTDRECLVCETEQTYRVNEAGKASEEFRLFEAEEAEKARQGGETKIEDKRKEKTEFSHVADESSRPSEAEKAGLSREADNSERGYEKDKSDRISEAVFTISVLTAGTAALMNEGKIKNSPDNFQILKSNIIKTLS